MARRATASSAILLVGMSADPKALAAFLDERFTVITARHVGAACASISTKSPAIVVAAEESKPWDLHVLREHVPEGAKLHLVPSGATVEEIAAWIDLHHPGRRGPRL